MNDKTYNLIMKVLSSDITREARTEIVKFFLLPRNTIVKPSIESIIKEDDEVRESLGPVSRPDKHDLDRKADPEMADEEDEMRKVLNRVDE